MLYLLFIVALSVAIAANGRFPASELETPILPIPKHLKIGDTSVYLSYNKFQFISKSKSTDLSNAFLRFKDQIFQQYNTNDYSTIKNAIILPSINVTIVQEDAVLQQGVDESYILTIPADGTPAQLIGQTIYGVYHGLESFSQLIRYDFVNQRYEILKCPINIDDAPAVGYRGLLIDTSRHFLSTNVIKKMIRALSYAKMNVLHWHMVDEQSVPIQSRKYPTFWDGAYSRYEKFTQTEIADIVEYARQRGVRVMVEFDVPGHGAAWCKGLPEICPSDTCKTPLDLSKDFTYQFLDEFFSEMTSRKQGEGLFPETFFHIGGDEVNLKCWDEVPQIKKWLKDRGMSTHDGYLYIVNKTQHIVMNQGRYPVNWEEIWTNFGTKLDKRTIIHAWLTRNAFVDAANKGYNTILSNYQVWYLDYLDTKWTTFYDNSITDGIKSENLKYVMGGEVCMWAETVDVSVLFQTVWPRAAAAAERLWTNIPRDSYTEDRMLWFRCYMTRQGIDAAPVKNAKARQNPPNQSSCYIQ